jgi:hypothetical protein
MSNSQKYNWINVRWISTCHKAEAVRSHPLHPCQQRSTSRYRRHSLLLKSLLNTWDWHGFEGCMSTSYLRAWIWLHKVWRPQPPVLNRCLFRIEIVCLYLVYSLLRRYLAHGAELYHDKRQATRLSRSPSCPTKHYPCQICLSPSEQFDTIRMVVHKVDCLWHMFCRRQACW